MRNLRSHQLGLRRLGRFETKPAVVADHLTARFNYSNSIRDNSFRTRGAASLNLTVALHDGLSEV